MAPQQKVQYVAERRKYFHKIANHPFLSNPIRPVTELTTRLRQKPREEMITSIAGVFIPHLVPKSSVSISSIDLLVNDEI